MDGIIDPVLQFAHANADVIFWLVLAFALAETTMVVSIFVPSTAILVGLGALVAADALEFGPLFAGAAIGALLGSTASWWIGRRFGPRVRDLWPVTRFPRLYGRALARFRLYGAPGVLFGHFVGAVRPFVFVAAGLSRLGFWKFSAWNVVGATAWAFLVLKSGELGTDLAGLVWRHLGGA